MKFTWKNFPENPLSHAPKLQNLKKVLKNFPGYPLNHAPIFGKIFRDLPIWVNTVANETQFRYRSRNLKEAILSCKYMKNAKYSDNEVKCKKAQNNDNKNTFKNLRAKLEYFSEEKEITLYHANKNYLEKFANMLLDNLSVFGKMGELGCFLTPVAIETQGDPINVRL